jgi:hypothetical protein
LARTQSRDGSFTLDRGALAALWDFIQRKAQFDKDASPFDDFNAAFRK